MNETHPLRPYLRYGESGLAKVAVMGSFPEEFLSRVSYKSPAHTTHINGFCRGAWNHQAIKLACLYLVSMEAETDWKNNLQKLHQESYLWSLSCCNFDEEMAKDVLQTVYLKIYDGKASYNKKSTLKTWLFSVIKFTSVDFMRKHKMHMEHLNDTHRQMAEPERTPETDNQVLFISILKSLSGQQREVLTLAFYHDLTLEKIAALLGLSIGSVRTHYERGKENFKRMLAKYNIDIEI